MRRDLEEMPEIYDRLPVVPNSAQSLRRGVKYTMLPYLRQFRQDPDGTRHKAILAYPASRKGGATAFINVQIRRPKSVDYTGHVAEIDFDTKAESYNVKAASDARKYPEIMKDLNDRALIVYGMYNVFEVDVRPAFEAYILKGGYHIFTGTYLCANQHAMDCRSHAVHLNERARQGRINVLMFDLERTDTNKDSLGSLVCEQIHNRLQILIDKCGEPGPNIERLEMDVLAAQEQIAFITDLLQTDTVFAALEAQLNRTFEAIDTAFQREQEGQ